MSEQGTPEAAKSGALQMMLGYFRDFKVLKECPMRYWGVQVINFLDCLAYFSITIVITLYLSKQFGLSDEQAGYVVMLFGIVTSISIMFIGPVTDWLGIRKSMLLALIGKLVLPIALGGLAFTGEFPGRGLIASILFAALGLPMAMIQPIYQAANARFTTKKSRGPGFNLWYLFMNLGALGAGLGVDFIRQTLNLSDTYVVLAGAVTSLLAMGVLAWMVRSDDPAEVEEKKPGEEDAPKKNPWQIFLSVIRESVFWKMLAMITLLLGVRAVFLYMMILMPKYWERTIGLGAAIGKLNAINPFLIVIGLILLIPIASKINVFKMLTWGAIISSLSLFALMIPWNWFSSDVATGFYAIAIISMILLSIGEIFWSPRLQHYIAAIAPKGEEGSYLGISTITWFVAKTIASALSGHMLTMWCPEKVTFTQNQLVTKLNEAGVSIKELADQLADSEVAVQAQNLGMSVVEKLHSIDPTKAEVILKHYGFDVADLTTNTSADLMKQSLAQMKIENVELFKDIDPGAFAVKMKVLAIEISEKITGGAHLDTDSIGVNLQLALKHGWIEFWHSPSAMWLILGLIAISGPIIAIIFKSWFTKGARFEDTQDA